MIFTASMQGLLMFLLWMCLKSIEEMHQLTQKDENLKKACLYSFLGVNQPDTDACVSLRYQV